MLGVTTVSLLAFSRPAVAATPSTLNFQARLETGAGAIVPDGNYNIEFKLYNTSTVTGTPDQGACTYNGGTTDASCLWVETRTGGNQVRVANGYLTVNLGSVNPFGSINWGQQLYLTMRIGGTGTPAWDAEMAPRIQLTAVPYAFEAGGLQATAGSFTGNLGFATLTGGNQTFQLPDQGAAGTYSLLTQNQGDGRYIQNTTSPQTANFDITGTGQAATFQAGTSVLTPLLDTAAAGALTIGTTNATAITLGNATNNILTTVSGTLTVKPTPLHDSTTALQVENAGGVGVLTVDTSNQTVTVRAGSDDLTAGSELYSGNFSSGWTTTGWNVGGVTTAAHTTGNTSSLINTNVSVTAGTTYQVSFILSGTCTTTGDTITAKIGGATLGTLDGTNCSGDTSTYVVTATGTAGLTFIPTTNWAGTISGISIIPLSGTINPALVVQNASGATNIEIRASSTTSNAFIGLSSGSNNTTGIQNTALGINTLQNNTTGSNNSALGQGALASNTTGTANTAMGQGALNSNTTGDYNTAVGLGALNSSTTSDKNTAIGYNSLHANTTGAANTAIGQKSLFTSTTGSNNTAVGQYSLQVATIGNSNSALGQNALGASTSGSGNTALGQSALLSNTTGGNNIALGYYAGYQDSSGFFSTLSNLQNAVAIGAYSQVQSSNSIVLGSVDAATNVGVGITVPSNTFSVSPLDYSAGTVTVSSGSASVTGSSTSWTGAMIGDIIILQDGFTSTVSTVGGSTSLTMSSSYSGSLTSGAHYRLHHVGLQVTSAGKVGIGTTNPQAMLDVAGTTRVDTTSSTAFQVQNASNVNVFTVDTSNTAIVLGNDGTPSAFTVRGGIATGTNVAGSAVTFDASNGTGSGGSGDLIFRTGAANVTTVTNDTNSSSTAASTNTLQWTHTTNNNVNRLLIVGVTISSTSLSVTSVTYHGANLTLLAAQNCASTAHGFNACRVEFWYMTKPDIGSYTVQVNVSGTVTMIDAGASTYYNVDQNTPIATSTTGTGFNNPSSVALSGTTAQQLVVDVMGSNNVVQVPQGAATQRWNTNTADSAPNASSSQTGGSGSTTVSWTDGSSDYADVVAALNPPLATSSNALQDRLHIAASGNVGISTSTPQHTLDVASMFGVDSTARQVIIGAGSTGEATSVVLVTDSDTDATYRSGTATNVPTEVDGAIFYDNTDGYFMCGVSGSWETCTGLLYSNTAASTAINTCTNACASFNKAAPIPANYCKPGRSIHVQARGHFSVTVTPTLGMGVYYGTNASTRGSDVQIGVSSPTPTAASGATNQMWALDFTIICFSATAMNGQGIYTFENDTTTTNTMLSLPMISTGNSTVASTTAKNLYIFPSWSASSASNTVILDQLIVTGN